MQGISSRIWTRIAESISSGDNRYAKRVYEELLNLVSSFHGISTFMGYLIL